MTCRWFALATLALAACAQPRSTEPTAPPPVGIPFVPGEAEAGLAIEQHVAVSTPYGTAEFDVFVETAFDRVVLVGMTTYGVRAFSVVHDSDGLHVDAAPLRELAGVPFDRVVRDVYAAFLIPGPIPPHEGVAVVDRREGTRLVARDVAFESTSAHPDRVVVDYGSTGWDRTGSPPTEVVLTHAQPALRIAITTRSFVRSP